MFGMSAGSMRIDLLEPLTKMLARGNEWFALEDTARGALAVHIQTFSTDFLPIHEPIGERTHTPKTGKG